MGERLVRDLVAAASGLLAAGVTVAAGEVAAAFVRPEASPIIVVGNRFITLTPEWLKSFAIREFGHSDKTVLLTGIYCTIALLSLVVGLLAVRRIWLGVLGLTIFGGLAIYCALTTAAARTSDVVPSVVALLAGVAALILLHRSGPRTGSELSRRGFLAAAVSTAAVAALAAWTGRAWQRSRFSAEPSRRALHLPAPTSPAPPLPRGVQLDSATPFQTSADKFYRVDIALRVPQIDAADWRLPIDGMVEHPITLTLDDLLRRPLIERWITLACVSNYVGGNLVSTGRFLGVPLAPILKEVGVHPDADQLLAHGKDGATIGTPTATVRDGRDAMLAIGLNGAPLPTEHGFPVRMVVPGLYGYVSACKWIDRITATTFADAHAFWVGQGWNTRGPIQLASRIDVPKSGAHVTAGETVTLAGIAWHQHSGIGRVEVRTDDGPWLPTKLGAMPSIDTWRQWALRWPVPSKGRHTLTVRAIGTDGTVQDSANHDPYPGPSSGWHSVTVTAH